MTRGGFTLFETILVFFGRIDSGVGVPLFHGFGG